MSQTAAPPTQVTLTEPHKKRLLASAQRAADAAGGDSNDKEISLLREALEDALHALGLAMPEANDD